MVTLENNLVITRLLMLKTPLPVSHTKLYNFELDKPFRLCRQHNYSINNTTALSDQRRGNNININEKR